MIDGYDLLSSEQKESLDVFCKDHPNIDVLKVQATSKRNLSVTFLGETSKEEDCVLDPFFGQVIDYKGFDSNIFVVPAHKRKKPSPKQRQKLLSNENQKDIEEFKKQFPVIKGMAEAEDFIKQIPFSEEIITVNVTSYGGNRVDMLVKYNTKGAVTHTQQISVKAKGKSTSTVLAALLSSLKSYDHIVDISEKKKAEIKSQIESSLSDATNHARSFCKKHKKREIPPMLSSTFFDQLKFFKDNKETKITHCRNMGSRKYCEVFYKGFSLKYNMADGNLAFGTSESVFREAEFWDIFYAEVMAFSNELDSKFPHEGKLYFSPVPEKSRGIYVEIGTNFEFINNASFIVDILDFASVKKIFHSITVLYRSEEKIKKWISRTKDSVRRITDNSYREKWVYSVKESTLTLTTQYCLKTNTYQFPALERIRETLLLIKKDCKAYEEIKKTEIFQKSLGSPSIAGSILHRAIYTIIKANDQRLLTTEVVKLLRGLSLPQYGQPYTDTEFTGKFALLHTDVVQETLADMISEGMIERHWVHGWYKEYFKLKPNPKYLPIFTGKYAPHTARTKPEEYTDDDWMVVIGKKPPPTEKMERWMDIAHILDRHALICFDMDRVATFLAQGPENLVSYIEARKQVSQTLVERKMYNTLLDKIGGLRAQTSNT